MLSVYKVSGDSMLPYLAAGDFVIACCLFFPIKPGDYIVANHPQYQRIIKRVDSICPQRGYWLAGENTASVSSEKMGWLSKEHILAKVIVKVRKPRR